MTGQNKMALILLAAVLAGTVAMAVVGFSAGWFGGSGLRAAFTDEFLERPDGYKGLTKMYGFQFSSAPKQMDAGLMYSACADGEVDVICAFATDGRIDSYNLKTLEDDKGFFPAYFAAPLVRNDTLRKHPQLKDVLNRLADRIDAKTMRALNLEVDRRENPRKPAHVARDFLIRAGLIDPNDKPSDGSAGTIVVGGKNFTEQDVLGEMMAILIESRTNLKVERKLYLGGTMVCFNGLRDGGLDLYAEYTGTGLVSILQRKALSDPQQTYQAVKTAFHDEYDLTWLQPFGFNNTYTLTMRGDRAGELGIATISDLADYVNNEQSPAP